MFHALHEDVRAAPVGVAMEAERVCDRERVLSIDLQRPGVIVARALYLGLPIREPAVYVVRGLRYTVV